MNCLGLSYQEQLDSRDYYRSALSPFVDVFSSIHQFAYRVLCVLGVLSNLCIIIILLRPTMRKSPFNLFLIIIAICDATLMATYFLYKQVEFCHPWFFEYGFILYTKWYAIFSVFVHSASLWLTVNMAVLRFLVLYRGSRSQSIIPPCNGFPAAILAICIAGIIAALGSLPNSLRYKIEFKGNRTIPSDCLAGEYASVWKPDDVISYYTFDKPSWYGCTWETVNYWMAALVLKLIPCVLLTIFMTLLVRMLIAARERRSRLCGGMATANSQAERTTAMLTVIVAVFLITELPQGLLHLAVGVNARLMHIPLLLGNFTDLLSLFNSAVNFVLCVFMSHAFRRECLNTFSACCPKSTESQSGAPIPKATRTVRPIKFLSGLLEKKKGFTAVPTTCHDDNIN